MEGSSRLRAMHGEVDEMLGGLRSQAPGFRHSLALLKSDLERELGSKINLYSSGNVDRYASRFNVLRGSFRPIVKMIREVEAANAQAATLKEDSGRMDAPVADHVRRKWVEWNTELNRMLSSVERSQDLEGPRRALDQVKETLGHYEEAVRQLTQAKTLIRQYGPVKTAEFQVGLRELQKTLLDGRLDVAWLTEMRRNLGSLRDLEDEPPPEPLAAPPSLDDCKRNVPYVARWRNALGLPARHEFAGRLQSAEDMLNAGRSSPDIEILAEALRAEIAELKEVAESRREEAQTKLQEDYRYFKDCCGEDSIQPEEAAKLTRLMGSSTDSPENYKDWKYAFDDASAYFLKISRPHWSDLSSHLRRRTEALEERLEAMKRYELSEEVQCEAGLVAGALKRLEGLPDAEVLAALRQVTSEAASSLNARVAALEGRSRGEWEEYQTEEKRLLELAQALRAAAAEVGIRVKDVALEAGESRGIGLAVLWERLTAFQGALTAEVDLLRAACVSRAGADLQFCRDVRNSLMVLGGSQPEILEAPQRIEGPMEAAGFALQAAVRRKDFEARAGRGIAELTARMEEDVREVEVWVGTPGYLATEDCDAAASWLADVLEERGLQRDSELDGLRAKSHLFSRCRSLFDRLKRDAVRVQKMKHDAVDRLQHFAQEELVRFFPEVTRRVAALVYGADVDGRQRTWAREQLEEAQRLLDLLEFQTRRLVAGEVMRGRAALGKLMLQTTDAGQLRGLKQLAASVDIHPDSEMVPLDLRRRLADLPREERTHG